MKDWHDIAGRALPATLYGIGVGPGNPRLLTLRAAGLIATVDVVAYFAKRGQIGNARSTVAPFLAEGRRELRLEYPMTDEMPVGSPAYRDGISAFYATAAADLAGLVGDGLSVGLLSEGDPFLFGSFMHMWRRLHDGIAVEVVPGVTGMSGCWTAAGAPIAWGDDCLAVIPATLPEATLIDRLRIMDAAVIMKLGRNLPKVRRALQAAGLQDRAIYVERGTMPGEHISPLQDYGGAAPYFSMVLVPGNGRRL